MVPRKLSAIARSEDSLYCNLCLIIDKFNYQIYTITITSESQWKV